MTTRRSVSLEWECAKLAQRLAESPDSPAVVWNGLSLASQNATRDAFGLPPRKKKGFLREPRQIRVGDTVRLKRATKGVPPDSWKEHAIVREVYSFNGVRLSAPLGGLRKWHVSDLVVVRQSQ